MTVAVLVVLALMPGHNAMAQDLHLDISNAIGARVAFPGSSQMVFNEAVAGPDIGFDFRITLQSGFTGNSQALLGVKGTISGTYIIGNVTSIGPGASAAPVTGMGTLTINDATGVFTSTIDWKEIDQDRSGQYSQRGRFNEPDQFFLHRHQPGHP